jgi:DNA polymerase elongation subunit (family B)
MATLNPINDDIIFQIIDFHTENYDKRENQDDDKEASNSDSDDDCEFTYDSDDDRYVRIPANEEEEPLSEKTAKYTIYIFGKDKNDKTYSIEITDFTPYMYIRIPNNCGECQRQLIECWIKSQLKPIYRDGLLRTSLLDKYSFRNFDNKTKWKFMRLVFNNTTSLKATVNLFQNRKYDEYQKKYIVNPKAILINGITDKPFTYDLYENMIDPLLKFIHHRKLKPVSWAKIKKGKWDFREHSKSHCNYDLTVRWNEIDPVDDVNNSRIKIMAYDIECDSAHGDFPIPCKDYIKLAREIYSWYLKLHKYKTDAAKNNNDNNIDPYYTYYDNIIKNKELFVKWCINKSFYHYKTEDTLGYSDELDDIKINDDDMTEISSIFMKPTKYDSKKKRMIAELPKQSIIDNVANKIAKKLIIPNYNTSIEVKREQQKIINYINKVLNDNLPPVEGDKTIQIGLSFMYYGCQEPYKNYMLTVGGCNQLHNAETICCKDETELLLKFRHIIILEDPEVITGYNIDGFDTAWLFKRAKELDIIEMFSKISRIQDFQSVLKERQVKGATGELLKREYVEMPGRIQMDIMPLVQKSYNLESYKLDDVSAEFMNGNVISIEYDEVNNQSIIKTNSVKGLRNNNYVMFNEIDGYLENKYMDGKKFEVFELDTKNKTFVIKDRIELALQNKKCLWCLGKDDTSPSDIFRLQKGSDSDRYIIAKYCMMDVILCMELVNKLELLTNNIGMANVCMNPLSWIIHRGQGVKILSLVAYFIKDKNYLLPYLYKDTFDRDGYEGAVVLDPMPNIYLDEPVSVLDYGSLYPSSMIERNLSHETIVTNPKYLGEEGGRRLNELGYDYEDVSYDIFKTTFTANGTPKDKEKSGVKTVRFVQYRDGTKGIIPQILQYLIKNRKDTRNKIAYQTCQLSNGQTVIGMYNEKKRLIVNDREKYEIPEDVTVISMEETYNDFQQKVLDGLQLAFKITANSLYGQIGAKTSDIYYKEIAASTTATGRERLLIARDYVEDTNNYPHKLNDGHVIYLKNKVIYGDSCTGDTPIILNYNDDDVRLTTFNNFNNSERWETYREFKSDDNSLTDKEQINTEQDDIKIWTHKGWSKVKRIIRHHTNKRIYRVLTHTGCVDVTEDHSLLDKNVQQVKPNECVVGMELLHSFPNVEQKNENDISLEEAFILGFFVGDGSCGKYDTPSGIKYSWALNNADLDILHKCKEYLQKVYPNEFKILDTIDSSGVYKLVPTINIKDICVKYRKLCYDNKCKIVPNIILESNEDIKNNFIDGLYASDGCRKDTLKSNCHRIDTKNKITAQSYYMLLKSLGYNVSINDRLDKNNIYRITWSKSTYRKNPNAIKKIRLLHEKYNDYVYDIETEQGVFHAGIGSMIIKNTDSVFVQFQCLDDDGRKLSGRAAREKSIKLAIETEHAIQEKKLRAPQVLEYEKTFHPFILFSKKRYVGDLYEFDPDKFSRKSMGIVLKRRDNAPIVKIVYGGIIDIIMKEQNIQAAVASFEKNMGKLLRGDYPMDALIISKTLSSYYKDPDRIAHKVLADRIAERDPGNKPLVGDRIPFVYVKTEKETKLQGDKIENPDYVRENSIRLDYEFYIMNQIRKPVTQIFALCLDKIPGFKGDMTVFDKIFEEMVSSNLWSRNECIKRINEMKRKEAEVLLLTSIRTQLGLSKQRHQDITKYVERANKRKATMDAKKKK